MTLLSICNNVAGEVGIDPLSIVVGNSSDDAVKLLRYANKAGLALALSFDWADLIQERTFTAIAGETQTGILPADFGRFIPETFWNRSVPNRVMGPVSSPEWANLKAAPYTGDVRKFIRRASSLQVIPVFAGGEALAFEYQSKNWCQSAALVGQSAWAADTDTAIIDEELITMLVAVMYTDDKGLPLGRLNAELADRIRVLQRNQKVSTGTVIAGDIFNFGSHYSGTPF